METIEKERRFLEQLYEAKSATRKSLIKKATKEQLEVVATCIYNVNVNENKCIKKLSSKIKKFIKTKFTINKLRKYLYSNQKFIVQIIGTILASILHKVIFDVCNNG